MISTADLYDLHGDALQSLPLQLRSFGGLLRFEGRIRTVRCFQDNALVKRILQTPGDGAVLVVDGAGSLETALMGDMIAQSAVDSNWAGVVINGCVRDSVALLGMPLGIKALGTNPRKSTKVGTGEVDVVVEFGGVTFRPGALLHADEDGILVER
ncbi:MAG: S-adenosylmethionine--2-demethylmenaquinone methyltransferase [Microbacterium sp. 69-10]|uniref:ribonuclease E activity regulator RraA n=1 Tax=Microbacterium sp. 69-10 TaxID=1895783 RepID=UPI00096494E8|nr:ribonuclease E activity regulator RraA [Microbacterium sp. 69-10]OJU38833.1 MAG: S-adenosylmethionine--2-demethylmenaquinone methyltransferase [Microbacterium sp. 69-10]